MPELIKSTDQSLLPLFGRVSSDIDEFCIGTVQNLLKLSKRSVGSGFRIKSQWKLCTGTDILDIHIVFDHLHIVCPAADTLHSRTDIFADRNNMVVGGICMLQKRQAWISLGLDFPFHIIMNPDGSDTGGLLKQCDHIVFVTVVVNDLIEGG